MEKQPKITIDTVLRSKKALKDLTPEQLLSLRDSSKQMPQDTYQLVINEINRRLMEGG